LNQQIKANAQQEALLPISNSTVAAVNQVGMVTDKLGETLKDNPARRLAWRPDLDGIWRASRSRSNVFFESRSLPLLPIVRIAGCFSLAGAVIFASLHQLDEAKFEAERLDGMNKEKRNLLTSIE
jgi:hypothetical protein